MLLLVTNIVEVQYQSMKKSIKYTSSFYFPNQSRMKDNTDARQLLFYLLNPLPTTCYLT